MPASAASAFIAVIVRDRIGLAAVQVEDDQPRLQLARRSRMSPGDPAKASSTPACFAVARILELKRRSSTATSTMRRSIAARRVRCPATAISGDASRGCSAQPAVLRPRCAAAIAGRQRLRLDTAPACFARPRRGTSPAEPTIPHDAADVEEQQRRAEHVTVRRSQQLRGCRPRAGCAARSDRTSSTRSEDAQRVGRERDFVGQQVVGNQECGADPADS